MTMLLSIIRLRVVYSPLRQSWLRLRLRPMMEVFLYRKLRQPGALCNRLAEARNAE